MTKMSKSKKYTIHSKLNKLSYKEYKIARNKLPLALKVNKRTFDRWMRIPIEDAAEIPADKLAVIAKFLGCKIEEMFNYPIPQFNTKKLQALEEDDLAQSLNLIR